MNRETLSLPVGYTLVSKPNGDFVATWEPDVPTEGLPTKVSESSRTSGMKALEKLYEKLLETGVVSR